MFWKLSKGHIVSWELQVKNTEILCASGNAVFRMGLLPFKEKVSTKDLCVPQELIVDILGSAGQGNVHYVNLEDIEKKEENRIFIKALQRWGMD